MQIEMLFGRKKRNQIERLLGGKKECRLKCCLGWKKRNQIERRLGGKKISEGDKKETAD